MPTAQIARVRAIPICVHYCAIDHIRTMSQTYCGANTCRGQHTPHLWYAPAPEHCSGAPKKLLPDFFQHQNGLIETPTMREFFVK